MEYQTIILEKKDYIATIILNRPDKLNALSPQMQEELGDVFALLDRDDETRVVVITGAGRAFCAGADIQKSFQVSVDKKKEGIVEDFTGKPSMVFFYALTKVMKPIIASINGYAVGMGCTMALACDIAIASEAARFSLNFTQRSTLPEFGSTYFLPRLVGIHKACELVLTAKMFDAKEAKEIGLVNEVVPADELAKATYEMASSIAKLPPLSTRMAKRGLYQGMNADLVSQRLYEGFAVDYLHGTEDFKEATKAFLEKRDPVFKGR
ncbi:enoyl-CoA hydratase/isomerase family protein [Chloroflexota bacterium]